ncbi:hypothetical protein V2J09_021114 [Rumex salicifolius]
MEVSRALLFTNNVPKTFWGEAVLTATYLINRLPTKTLDLKSPVNFLKEFFPSWKPSSLEPRVFGCTAFVHIHAPLRGKLDPKAQRCLFLGYSPTQKGYKCYDPTSKKFFISMDVTFHENSSFFPKKPHASEDEHPGFFNLPSLDIDPTPSIEFGSQEVDSPLPQSQDRFTQVYSRRNKAILPPPQQAPSSNHDLELVDTPNEGTLLAPPSPIHDITNLDLDIPIALRKNTRECTKRPLYPIAHNITYAVSVVSQFMHDPREPHLLAVYRILHYLKGCPGKGVLFKRGNKLTIEAFTDADYASSVSDRRSTSGYCVLIGGNLVSWRSKKQNVVARSSAEFEFRALAQGMCELLWVQMILKDLRIVWEGPMVIRCNNKSAISIAQNPIQHDRTKHVEVDRHFIKEKLDSGVMSLSYVPTEDQLVDALTKGLHHTRFSQLMSKLGMTDLYLPA